MINGRLKIGSGGVDDIFTKWGLIYVSADNRYEAPTKGFASTSYAEESGEHIDPRTVPAAFDYKVKFLVLAPNSNIRNANERIAEFNKALYTETNGIRTYKQVTFHNDYKRVMIVGYPQPIAEAETFWRDKNGKLHDCVQVEWTIRVNDPTLCNFSTGNSITVTSTADAVVLTIDGKPKTYAVMPDVPTKIAVDVFPTSIYRLVAEQPVTVVDLSDLETSNVTYMPSVFYNCNGLTSVNLSNIDTRKATNMNYIFYSCRNLASIDLSSFDMGSVTSANGMFQSCISLKNLVFGTNCRVSMNFSQSPLTHESALSVINGLADVEEAQTVTFSKATYNTLSEEEIALATSKGWNIAHT